MLSTSGGPLLGIHVNPARDGSIAAALTRAGDIGVQALPVGAFDEGNWAHVEIAPFTYDWPEWLTETAQAAGTTGLVPIYALQTPVNMHMRWEVPADLAGLAFDDDRMVERLAAFVCAFADHVSIGDGLLSIGNEINTYFAAAPSARSPFLRMWRRVRGRVKDRHPGVRIGTTFTAGDRTGLLGEMRDYLDWIGMTCYAFGRDPFGGEPYRPTWSARRVDEMLAVAGGVPIVITEFAMPTSPLLGGSEELQSDFLRTFVAALRSHPGSFIAAMWWVMHDLDRAHAEQLTASVFGNLPGGVSQTPEFREYLRTLGLFDRDGQPKASADVWRTLS